MKKNILLAILLFSLRLSAQPACQWAYIPTATSQTHNTIYNVVTDHSGNIIEAGILLGSGADMNPGSGPADTSLTGSVYNYYISKTSITGHLLWIRYFQNNSQIGLFEFQGLKINSENAIVVIGNYTGMIDFDLSDTGVDTLRSHFPTYPDYFVAKYDSSGNYNWAISIGDPTTSNIEAQALTILPGNNIVIVANPNGTVDVDPGVAVHNSIGGNANIICYDNNGNYVWNNHIIPVYSYGISNNSLDCDSAGNTYLLSVGYYEMTVNKFDINGMNLWDKTIGDFSSGARVEPQSVLVDKATGDFYVAGTFGDTVDFDPGVSVVNKISNTISFQQGFIAKYDQNMNIIWINHYEGNVSFGKYSIDFDNNNIVAAGNLKGTIDFGNGFIFTSPNFNMPLYIKLNGAGIMQDGFTINGTGGFNTINTSLNQYFVTSGNISGTIDMDPTSGTLMLNSAVSNHFTAVYQTSNTTWSKEINKKDFITLYPNPANNRVNLKVDVGQLGYFYNVIDYTGKIALKGIITAEKSSIELDKLTAGVYMICVGENSCQSFILSKD